MTKQFKCRINGEEWTDVADAHYDEMAARFHVEHQDIKSGMELFEHDDAEVIVEVMSPAGVITKVSVTREFTPMYCTAVIDPKPEPATPCDIPV